MDKKTIIISGIIVIILIGGIFGFIRWNRASARRDARTTLQEEMAMEYNAEYFFDFALSFGNIEALELFLKASWDIDEVNEQGETALIVAAKEELNVEGDELLEVVEFLIDNDADVDARDDDGRSALTWAIERNNFAMVDLILEAGADINQTADDGRTPFSWARERDMAVKLIDAGADIEEPDAEGRNALMRAARRSQPGTVQVLIAEGLDVNHTDNYGRHSLIYLTSYFREEYPEMVELLLENGAEIDLQDEQGRTALRWAAERRHHETIAILLEAGAEVNVQDNDGETPLIAIAPIRSGGSVEIAQMLIDFGADVTIEDNRGKTALNWAEKYGREEMVELIEEQM